MSETFVFSCSHWKEEPERVIVPLVAANTAAIAGQKAIVFCTMDAVWIGTEGGLEGVAMEGFPDPSALLPEFVANEGQLWLCQTCAKPRGVTEDMLVDGAKIVGAARLVEEVLGGARQVSIG
jgi:predicted peroxiredoxin